MFATLFFFYKGEHEERSIHSDIQNNMQNIWSSKVKKIHKIPLKPQNMFMVPRPKI